MEFAQNLPAPERGDYFIFPSLILNKFSAILWSQVVAKNC